MNKRKIILLSATGILLCVYILQVILVGKNSVKTFTIKEEPTSYNILANGETVILSKENDIWIVSNGKDEKYKANAGFADNIQSNVTEIKSLDVVSHSDSETVLERYGLGDGAVKVVALDKNGKEIRTLIIGKESSTGSQTYVKIDSGKDIYLVSGALKSVFGKSVEDLRSKEVYRFDGKEIGKVNINSLAGNWTFETKNSNTEKPEWTVSGIADKLDDSKITSWINSLAILNVETWRNTSQLPKAESTEVTIYKGEKIIQVTIYQIAGEAEGEVQYIGTCSETPYSFTLNKYMAGKFLKSIEELK